MIHWKQLSPALRAAVAAPWLLVLAAVAVGSPPPQRHVMNDAANQPTVDVSLSSPHWTGTLDPARLPASVALLDAQGNLSLSHILSTSGTVIAARLHAANGYALLMDAVVRLY